MADVINASRKLVLPRTGQLASYRQGDDFDCLAGFPAARAAGLLDLGDGTVLDRATGLVWVKQPELIIPGETGVQEANQIQYPKGDWANLAQYYAADVARDAADSTYWACAVTHWSAEAPNTFADDRESNPAYWRQTIWTASAANLTTPAAMTWNNAIDACTTGSGGTGLTYAGFGPWSATNPQGWRLPNLLEMVSILNYGAYTAHFAAFPNTYAGAYWTATTFPAWSGTYAWNVETVYGGANVADKTIAYRVRPVRGGIVLGQ